MTTDLIASWTY